jgi:hypothetical protein
MRQQLFAYVASGGPGLHALVPEAIGLLESPIQTQTPTQVKGAFGEA